MHFYDENSEAFSDAVNVSNSVIMKGCSHSNLKVLQDTMVPSPDVEAECTEHPTKENLNKLSKAVKILIRKLKPEILASRYKSDLELTYFKPETKAGFRYEGYLQKFHKKDCVNEARFIARKR
jgi:hypothetical protein